MARSAKTVGVKRKSCHTNARGTATAHNVKSVKKALAVSKNVSQRNAQMVKYVAVPVIAKSAVMIRTALAIKYVLMASAKIHH